VSEAALPPQRRPSPRPRSGRSRLIRTQRLGDEQARAAAAAAPPESSSLEPWNMPGPELDCSDIRKKVWISGLDYHELDRDGDGWACESFG